MTGVSGSGKSTLVLEELKKHLEQILSLPRKQLVSHKKKYKQFPEKVLVVNQKPIGKTPRSTPASYADLLTPIRDIFAQTKEARKRGWKKSRFSYNSSEGRCEHCEGRGALRVEMHFLSDVWITCTDCNGSRFNPQTLSVLFKGKSIAEVLNLSISEASNLFKHHGSIKRKLDALEKVGLGYLKLGQPANQLSSGEAQRLKLAKELAKGARGQSCCFLLDEPTTGLHFGDQKKLLAALHELVDNGHTVIIIEHNLTFIRASDQVIDLGPEGGRAGGHVLYSGPPKLLKTGHTAEALQKSFRSNKSDN